MIAFLFAAVALLLDPPMPCNGVDYLAGVIASEGARQPLEAQYAIARGGYNVLCDYGAESYLTGLAVANRAAERGDIANHHYRAYYALDTFDAGLVARWRQIARDVLAEAGAFVVRHFGRIDDGAAFWQSARSCPSGIVSAGDIKWC